MVMNYNKLCVFVSCYIEIFSFYSKRTVLIFQWTHYDFLVHKFPPTSFRTSKNRLRIWKSVFMVEFLSVLVFFFPNKKETSHQKFTPSSEVNHSRLWEIFMCFISGRYSTRMNLIFSGNSGKPVLMYRRAETDLSTLLGRKPIIFIIEVSILKHFCDLQNPCSSGSFKTYLTLTHISLLHKLTHWIW